MCKAAKTSKRFPMTSAHRHSVFSYFRLNRSVSSVHLSLYKHFFWTVFFLGGGGGFQANKHCFFFFFLSENKLCSRSLVETDRQTEGERQTERERERIGLKIE